MEFGRTQMILLRNLIKILRILFDFFQYVVKTNEPEFTSEFIIGSFNLKFDKWTVHFSDIQGFLLSSAKEIYVKYYFSSGMLLLMVTKMLFLPKFNVLILFKIKIILFAHKTYLK